MPPTPRKVCGWKRVKLDRDNLEFQGLMVTRGKTKADFCKRWMKISDETKACGRKGGMISTALHGKSIARIFSPSSTSPAHFYFYSHLKERMAWRSSAEAGGVRTSIMMRWRPEAKEANHTELRDKGMMLFLLLYKAHAKTRTLDLADRKSVV